MSRVLARKMFKKNAPKRSAKGVGITSMLEDEVAGYAEGGEVNKDDRAERERMAQDLLDLGRAEYQMFAEGERPQMTRPPATMGMVPQPNPQAAQAAQMQQMAQMGMLPRFQEGGIVQRSPLSGWGSRIRGWSELLSSRGSESPTGATPAMNNPDPTYNPEFRLPSGITALPAVTPQQDSLASRLAVRRSAEAQRMAAEEEAIQKRNQAQNDVIQSPEGQEAMRLMTEGRILNDPALYQKGRDALRTLTDTAYSTRGAETGPAQTGGFTSPPAEPLPSVAPMRSESAEVERDRRAAEPKKEAPKTPPLPPSERKANDLTDIKAERESKAAMAKQENMWLALMQAGLAIAGGRSPNAITNIGQGGQAGLASFMALEQQRRRDEDAAMRRDIAEKEFRLQERRLQAQEPLLSAQAEYYRNRPAMDAARLQAQQQVARQRAVDAAQKAWENRTKSGPYAIEFMKMNDVQKKAAEELYLRQEFNRRYNEELSAFRAGVYGGGQRETGPSAEE
jgi:hypothetical protein